MCDCFDCSMRSSPLGLVTRSRRDKEPREEGQEGTSRGGTGGDLERRDKRRPREEG